MRKILTVTIAATFSSVILLTATDAAAQASATAAPSVAKPASHAKQPTKAHPVKHVVKKKVPVAAAKEIIPADAARWNCAEGESIYVAGDMKHDQILTVYFDHKSHKLPRETTTTGADRFYDPASAWDLVVIPTKAMLFQDRDHDRLADECKPMQ
jgi:hypothetical protein